MLWFRVNEVRWDHWDEMTELSLYIHLPLFFLSSQSPSFITNNNFTTSDPDNPRLRLNIPNMTGEQLPLPVTLNRMQQHGNPFTYLSLPQPHKNNPSILIVSPVRETHLHLATHMRWQNFEYQLEWYFNIFWKVLLTKQFSDKSTLAKMSLLSKYFHVCQNKCML